MCRNSGECLPICETTCAHQCTVQMTTTQFLSVVMCMLQVDAGVECTNNENFSEDFIVLNPISLNFAWERNG